MAQSGFTPISLYYSSTGAAVPSAGNLVAGELALNTNDGKLYYKNSSGVVTLLAGATSGPAGGSTTQVQYNNAGVLAGITGATTNGTALTLTAPVLGTPASGTVTNLTGTASININGTVGATTPAAGAFTTGTFSSTLSAGQTTIQGFAAPYGLLMNSVTTNATDKYGTLFVGHYTNAEEPVIGISVQSGAANNFLRIGGGYGEFNAATSVDIYAAATTTTTTGTKIGAFTSTGLAVTGLVDISAATSGQIKFPATQNASADANTLDDYEEGTFTAAISTASGTVSANDTTGYYTKIGNQVSVRGYLNVTGVSSPSGVANITGLPFTSGGTYGAASISLTGLTSGATTSVQAYVQYQYAYITVVIYNAGARVEAGPYFQTNAQVVYSATYNV